MLCIFSESVKKRMILFVKRMTNDNIAAHREFSLNYVSLVLIMHKNSVSRYLFHG